ncbi:Retrovirus-related Pol polyprotein from transposon TNT 1-94 [Sesamum angolense]|uniref:Retrovirus-related Pol polyprotein from transposon TNT 1-94 n=1 Tax=Sesamum angolense TaxID=2727404 RepID=A0AAE2BTJ8_9LAMI|nr:Retrovirus-related Pol polyprotein from transposon TNT 1-94 [Sesamum angolense]
MCSEKNETWELVDLPKEKRPIGCKWVFRVKLKPTGEMDRYKACLVAKGYNQVAGVDYVESFFPVAKCVTAQGADFLALLVYVDDVLLCGSSSFLIDVVKNYLDAMFTIKDLRYSKYFLGLEIARAPTGTTVTQTKYVLDLIADTGLTHSRTTNTPLLVGIKLTAHANAPLTDPEPY